LPHPAFSPVRDAAAATAEGAVLLARFDVVERTPRKADATALKLPTPLLETPRSVSVMDADRIEEQNFQTLDSTFRYVPGIFNFAVNNDSYHFLARGFDTGPDQTLVDGFSGLLVGGSFSPSLFGIEQVVYLRGPTSLLYGAASVPSGVINLLTKKPLPTSFTRINYHYSTYAGGGVMLGSHGSHQVSLDTNGFLTPDGRLLYRFAAEIENRGYHNDGILDRQRAALLTLTWKFGRDERFTLTPVLKYQRQPFGAGRGLVISPSTSLSTTDGRNGPINERDLTPLTRNLSSGERTLTSRIAGFDLDARLSPPWSVAASYRFIGTDTESNQFTPQAATLRQLDPANSYSWVIQRRSGGESDRSAQPRVRCPYQL